MTTAVWVNGERRAPDDARVSALDRGLTLADGLFETMHAHAGTPFRLARHLARLTHGLARLGIPAPETLGAWVAEAAAESSVIDASVRVTVTRGVGPGGLAPPPDARPTVVVAVAPLRVDLAVHERGLAAVVAAGRRNERAMSAGLKTLAYTDAILALVEARRAGADEALFLDTEGHCSEATASNVLAWVDGTLVTPPVSCAALPGITRATVLELAAARGLPTAERPLTPDELLGADEAFLTSSLRGLAPLVRLDGRAIGRGTPGALTLALASAYAALVREECGRPATPIAS